MTKLVIAIKDSAFLSMLILLTNERYCDNKTMQYRQDANDTAFRIEKQTVDCQSD